MLNTDQLKNALISSGAFYDKNSAIRIYQDSNLSLDKFGTVAVLRAHIGLRAQEKSEVELLLSQYFESGVFWVLHTGGKSSIFHSFGDVPEELWVTEGELKFLVRPSRHPHAGLFLDTQSVRNYLLKNSANCTVLNLFSFTCSLSVAAHLGGAKFVRNIDSHGGILKWGNENLRGNNIPSEKASMIKEDVGKFLKKAKEGTYDLIILDPPSFGVSKGGRFSIHEDINLLFSELRRILAKNGKVIALNHDTQIAISEIIEISRQFRFSPLESFKAAWNRNGPSSSTEWVILT